jgi:hypothetical protein
LFCKFLPVIAMAEVKTVMPQAHDIHHEPGEPYNPDEDRTDYRPDEGGYQ